MPHAMIFDAVRTPRGKGKKDGSLHEVKPVDLLAGLLTKLQKRLDFDPAQLDDVVMGVVSPIGETTPITTSSSCDGSKSRRFCSFVSRPASRSTGFTSCRLPSFLPLPRGVRTASKIIA